MNLSLRKRHDPVNGGLARLREDVERTFDRFFEEPFGLIEPTSPRSERWLPAIDLSENEKEITVRAEVPGVDEKNLDITVEGRTLVISGKKEEKKEEEGGDFYRCERRFGSFKRIIDLPETADPEKVTADSDNGVVTVHVAKQPGAKRKQIEVKPAGKKIAVTS